jgi:hypothetical protein
MLYTLNGDFTTGNLTPLFGIKSVSTGDVTWTETTGGAGSANDELEVGEVFSQVGVGSSNFTYRGYFDTAGPPGRLYIFEQIGGFGDILVASQNDALTDAANDDDFPDIIQATSINQSQEAFCFVEGTFISTPEGDRLVETLNVGDLVCTASGDPVPVKWVGRMTVPFPALMPEKLAPIVIGAGALGEDLPTHDLHVSADHGLIVDGYVINASALVNHSTICFKSAAKPFTYHHIETENHDMILANGTPAETFIDATGRKDFDNYDEYLELYGEERAIREMPMPRILATRMLPVAVKARVQKATDQREQELLQVRRSA